MDSATVLLMAAGLAMDSFSVSVASGLAMKTPRIVDALKMGGSFGFFQAFMPIIGWLAAVSVMDLISGIDHWVAFGLLVLIGFRMAYGSCRGGPSGNGAISPDWRVLLMLSVATSIDALAVGVSLAFLRSSIAFSVIAIGTVTFLLSFFGVYFGNRFGCFFGSKVETVGGLVLIGIGVKILVEHLL